MSEQIDKKISEQLDHSIAYIRHGNLGEAKNCLAVAHSFNRTHLDLHYVTGLYLSAVNNLELALDHLEKELRLFPTNDAAREFLRSLQFIKSNVQGETRTLRIASPGLCQSEVFASLLSRLLPNAHVKFFRVGTSSCQGPNFIHELNFEDFDHVIMPRLGDYFGKMSYQNCKTKPNVTFVPSIVFSGYHPDCIYINDDQARVFKSPIGDYHSLIVYCSFLHNLSVDECLALFQPDFYREFGFFQDYKNSMQLLIEELDLNGLDGTFLSQKWAMQGPFMYSFNHAKQFVLNDLAVAVCNRMGLKIRRGLSLDTIGADTLAAGPVLPVYPGLPGTQTTGQIYFKQSTLYPLQERS